MKFPPTGTLRLRYGGLLQGIKGESDNAIETNMALDMASKKIYDYRDQLHKENRNFMVEGLREKWFGAR